MSNSVVIEFDTRHFEAERLCIRAATDGKQEMRALDGFFTAICGKRHADHAASFVGAYDIRAFPDADAFGRERIEENVRRFAVFTRERRRGVEHSDGGAEPAKYLRAGADDDEVFRNFMQIE
jgi:hypothetical protein